MAQKSALMPAKCAAEDSPRTTDIDNRAIEIVALNSRLYFSASAACHPARWLCCCAASSSWPAGSAHTHAASQGLPLLLMTAVSV